eukprot:TRINITY_DN4954_c0_g1_i1.p1 TRINITY_DN4954_c0_g1~~TRINITY_DN4954_c0_g1_i1.p1  ORF type:complete len:975 (+),score=112.57 TRINITY_DN4954_c0_g1_i1:1612-4536(+)
MLLTSWDSLFVLGMTPTLTQFGLYELNSTFVSLNRFTLPVPMPPGNVMRNPFFRETADRAVVFRVGASSLDAVLSYNRGGVVEPVRYPTPFPPPNANVTAFGPVPTFGGPYGVFYAIQNGTAGTTFFELHRYDADGAVSAIPLAPRTGPLNLLNQFRGAFLVANSSMYLMFNDGFFFANASSRAFSARIIDEILFDSTSTSIVYVLSQSQIFNLNGTVLSAVAGETATGLYNGMNTVLFGSIRYSTLVDSGQLLLRYRDTQGGQTVVLLSNCSANGGLTRGLKLGGTNGNASSVVLALQTQFGLTLKWLAGGFDVFLEPFPPTIRSDITSGFERPYAAEIKKKVSNNLFILHAQIQTSQQYVTVFAELPPAGQWVLTAQLARKVCELPDKPYVTRTAFSPDLQYVVMAVVSGAQSLVYFGPTNDSSALIGLNGTSGIAINWYLSDLADVEIPVAFGPQNFSILARLGNSSPMYYMTFALNGTLLEKTSRVASPERWSVSPGFPQHLFYTEFSSFVFLDTSSTSAPCSSCRVAALSPTDAVVWAQNGTSTSFQLIKSGLVEVIDTVEHIVTRVYPVPSLSGNESTFIFYSDNLVLVVGAFWNSILLGEQTILNSTESVSIEVCGVWSGGIVLTIDAIDVWTYRIAGNAAALVYSNPKLIRCIPIGSISDGLFLLTASDAHIVLNVKTATSATTVLPGNPSFVYSGGSDVVIYPNNTGGNIITTINGELDSFLQISSVIVLDTVVCALDSDCSSGLTCQSNVCKSSFLPAGQIPQSAPACAGPAPVLGALCVGSVWVIQGDVIVSNGSILVGSDTKINGSLVIATGSTITLTGTATLNATGCASFGGSLEVERPAPEQTVIDGRLVVISFGGGFCNNTQTTFGSTTLRFLGQPACAKLDSSATRPEYSPTSVAIVFNYDLSECNGSSVLSPGAIAGITVGAVALVAIVVGLVLFFKFKGVVSPFSQKQITTQVELD